MTSKFTKMRTTEPGRLTKSGVGEVFFLLKLSGELAPRAGERVFLVEGVKCSFEQWRDAGDGRRHKEQLDDGEVVYGRMRNNAVELFLVYGQDGRLDYNTALQPLLEASGKVVTLFDHRSERRSGRVATRLDGNKHEGRSLSASPNDRRPRTLTVGTSTDRKHNASAPPAKGSIKRRPGAKIEPYVPRQIIVHMGRQVKDLILPPISGTALFGNDDFNKYYARKFSFLPFPPGLSNIHHSNQQKTDGRVPHQLPARSATPEEWNNKDHTDAQYSPAVSSRAASPTEPDENMAPHSDHEQSEAGGSLNSEDIDNIFNNKKTNLILSMDAVNRTVNSWAVDRNVSVDYAYIADPQNKPVGKTSMLLIVIVTKEDFPGHRDDRILTAGGVDYPRIGYIEDGVPIWTCSEEVWKRFFVYGCFDDNQGGGPQVMALLMNSKVDDWTSPGPKPSILDDLAKEEEEAEREDAAKEKKRLKKLAAREKAREKKVAKEEEPAPKKGKK